MTAPIASGRVLPTMNEDGSRNWIRPKPSAGAWWQRRRIVAYVLMAWFFAVPHLRIAGKPVFLLDLPAREFTIFGYTFLPTDTLLFMLLLATILITIFLATALFGRVWCGWACPQTIYMEFVYRPIERLIEGGYAASRQIDRTNFWFHPRRMLKYVAFFLISLVVTHTILAFFVGNVRLAEWMSRSPVEHPTTFFLMVLATAVTFYNFTFFREQTCLILCPYGRWQSVLLDRKSKIVAYDFNRGEPRGKGGRTRDTSLGDCIDCGACVQTCPTGIDIRNGLQMECIHCTQCADACDAIMTKIGKPTGLVRYSSQDELAGRATGFLRPRTVLYPAALSLFVGAFAITLATKDPADVTILRGIGAPFTEEADGRVANQVRVKVTNRTGDEARYTIAIDGVDGGQVIAPENPLTVAAGETRTTSVFVLLPRAAFDDGRLDVSVRVTDGEQFRSATAWRLLGPEHRERRDDDATRRDANDDANDDATGDDAGRDHDERPADVPAAGDV